MQGRLLHLIARRLHSSTSQLSSLRRYSSSSEEALTENPTQHIKQPQSYTQNPPNSESHPNPNPNSSPNPNPSPQYNPNPNPNLVPNPRIGIITNRSSDASLPEIQKCIWAVERLSKGTTYAAFDRKKKRVPGYVYEQDSPEVKHVLILMDTFQIESLWGLLGEERFLRTVFTLEVFDGFGSLNILYRQPVLPRRVNFDESGKIANVGFAKALPGMKLRLDVPIHIYGQEDCTGLKKGGFLKVHLSHASLFCLPEELPSYLEVDINNMDIGDMICLGDLRIGVPLHSNNEQSLPVCEII